MYDVVQKLKGEFSTDLIPVLDRYGNSAMIREDYELVCACM